MTNKQAQITINAIKFMLDHAQYSDDVEEALNMAISALTAKPEQRYTEEELRVFKHGISLSLLSKRSSQHWRYDADTAVEIEFLERLYDKVSADMKGGQG